MRLSLNQGFPRPFLAALKLTIFGFVLITSTLQFGSSSAHAGECATDEVSITTQKAGDQTIAFLFFVNNPELCGMSSHSKISVNGRAVNTMSRFKFLSSDAVMERRAEQATTMSHVRFEMPVLDSAQYLAIIETIEKNKAVAANTGTCAMGACELLRMGGIVVPPPFDALPTFTAAYLLALKAFGVMPVKISFHGFRSRVAMVPFGLPLELTLGPPLASLGYLELAVKASAVRSRNLFRAVFGEGNRAKICSDILKGEPAELKENQNSGPGSNFSGSRGESSETTFLALSPF